MFIIDDIINAITGSIAAGQQGDAAKKAMDLQERIYGQTRGDQLPWLGAGRASLANLLKLTSESPSFSPSDIANDPSYQFRLSEGQKALERSASARGGRYGGTFAKALTRFGQGLASEEYGNAWNRAQADYGNRWNRLAQLSGMGQNAAQSLGGLGTNFANSMSGLYGAKGNADASGTMAIGNGIAGAVRSAGNMAMMGFGGGLGALGGLAGMGGGGAATTLVPTQAPLRMG